jgi:hypothetical protein
MSPTIGLDATHMPAETLQRILAEQLRFEEAQRFRRILLVPSVLLAVLMYMAGIYGRDVPAFAAIAMIAACLLPTAALYVPELRHARRLRRYIQEAVDNDSGGDLQRRRP